LISSSASSPSMLLSSTKPVADSIKESVFTPSAEGYFEHT
jgi:hypothetical protein